MLKIHPVIDYDVAIIGAGPAGAAAAAWLAKSGYKVILLDYQQFPRDKVCGDFVGPVAINELTKLGVDHTEGFAKTNIITEAAVFLDGKPLITSRIPKVESLPDFGRVIPRLLLDTWILNAAISAGAEVFQNCRLKDFRVHDEGVIIHCEKEGKQKTFTSRLLIGADGSNSTVARLLSGNKHSSQNKILAVRAYWDNITITPNRAELYFSENSFPGYYWLFPTGKNSANLGVGMVLETLPKNETHLKELLNKLIEQDPILRSHIGNQKPVGKILGWPLSTFDPNLKLVHDRVILAGDAGGLINALNGEGIQYALLSGRWAAEISINCLQKNAFSAIDLSTYENKVQDVLGYELALSRLVIQFIRNRSLNTVWLKLFQIIVARANIDPRYADTAGGVLAGIVPANKVLNPSFIASTLLQGAITIGFDGMNSIVKGPNHWKKSFEEASIFSKNLSENILENPRDYSNWVLGLGKDALRLSKNVVSDIFK